MSILIPEHIPIRKLTNWEWKGNFKTVYNVTHLQW